MWLLGLPAVLLTLCGQILAHRVPESDEIYCTFDNALDGAPIASGTDKPSLRDYMRIQVHGSKHRPLPKVLPAPCPLSFPNWRGISTDSDLMILKADNGTAARGQGVVKLAPNTKFKAFSPTHVAIGCFQDTTISSLPKLGKLPIPTALAKFLSKFRTSVSLVASCTVEVKLGGYDAKAWSDVPSIHLCDFTASEPVGEGASLTQTEVQRCDFPKQWEEIHATQISFSLVGSEETRRERDQKKSESAEMVIDNLRAVGRRF